MHEVVFAPEAEAHLLQIFDYIAAAASPEIAADYTEAIVRHCESLQTFPMRGAQRDDIRPGLRVVGFRRRVSIAFEIESHRVTILGIYYRGRRIELDFE
jgi:plasmid stabilization system protein ParE